MWVVRDGGWVGRGVRVGGGGVGGGGGAAPTGLPGGSGCGLKAWAVPEARPKPTSPRLPDRRALPAIFLMLSVVVMDFRSLLSADGDRSVETLRQTPWPILGGFLPPNTRRRVPL